MGGCRERVGGASGEAGEGAAESGVARGEGTGVRTQERKEGDKKLQGALEGCLIELTGFKGKAGSSCAASLRELRELEKDVEALDREAKVLLPHSAPGPALPRHLPQGPLAVRRAD